MGHLELQIFGHVCFHCCLGKMRSQEAAVPLECVAWRTHGFSASPVGLLSQAVHTKNRAVMCVRLRCLRNMMHTCFKSHHEKNN